MNDTFEICISIYITLAANRRLHVVQSFVSGDTREKFTAVVFLAGYREHACGSQSTLDSIQGLFIGSHWIIRSWSLWAGRPTSRAVRWRSGKTGGQMCLWIWISFTPYKHRRNASRGYKIRLKVWQRKLALASKLIIKDSICIMRN